VTVTKVEKMFEMVYGSILTAEQSAIRSQAWKQEGSTAIPLEGSTTKRWEVVSPQEG
jgi:hypothetical protein